VREDAALGEETPYLNEAAYRVRLRVLMHAHLFGEESFSSLSPVI
jgi:hypothetical protein